MPGLSDMLADRGGQDGAIDTMLDHEPRRDIGHKIQNRMFGFDDLGDDIVG